MANVLLYDDRYKDLAKVNWDFENSSQDALANIHPYPDRFINEILKHLIETVGCPSEAVVLDPFSGSRRTLVEAQKHKFDSVGIDLNPIACLFSKGKTRRPLPTCFYYLRKL